MAALDHPRGHQHNWRPAATSAAVVAGVVLGVSMADIGAAILRLVLLLAATTAAVVLTTRHIHLR
ncbi:MAG TPA: hypothetical protein VN738_04190 [Acidothermaceae bacterium]|nr:hypothetical protein [Acidothermaceae bacterium]